MNADKIYITDCPRDAMQGISHFIPTETKIKYLNQLLKVGFDVLDFGSFVSPKMVPQMADTVDVLTEINKNNTSLLAIIANLRGAQDACKFEKIDFLGFPLSVSETFQQRNTNKSISQAWEELFQIQQLAQENNKKLKLYLSMGFGNPYGDEYNSDLLLKFTEKLLSFGINDIIPSDTIGKADAKLVKTIYRDCITAFPEVNWGAHLHAKYENSSILIEAVIDSNVKHIEGALGGWGGCPFADNDLVGNIPTEIIIDTLSKKELPLELDLEAFSLAVKMSKNIFN
ncbi:MAG: hypothetical protein RLZZ175_2182 [Bacteroidota bacterium]|jgi:hydroxymethylglutaryl-CoA lyase